VPWQRLLSEVIRARAASRAASVERSGVPLARFAAGGCLRRVLLLMVLVFFALVAAVVFFGQALLHQL